MDVKKGQGMWRGMRLYELCKHKYNKKIDDIDAIIEETLQEDSLHDIDEIVEWVFGEDVWEEVEDECDEESDIDQN